MITNQNIPFSIMEIILEFSSPFLIYFNSYKQIAFIEQLNNNQNQPLAFQCLCHFFIFLSSIFSLSKLSFLNL